MSLVDNRVVEMQFNNAQFERGVAQTTSSLDRLKQALNFGNQTKGFDDVNSAAHRVDLGFLEKRFSTLGIVGMTAIQNITNRLVDLGFKIKRTFTSSIIQGGFTRALNIEQAKFQIEGLNGVWDKTSKNYKEGMRTIRDATLDAVKGTAYGLDEAAKVSSQLLASGIDDVDELQRHMQSVAGVAAMTGSSYAEIGRIFTQTAGQGAMMGDQLMELSARGLNAAATLSNYFSKHKKEWEEAKKVLTDKDIAKLGGKLTKPTEAAVREIASKRGITFKMFSDALNEAFGKHAKDANKTYTGALSNMKAALARIGADIAGDYLNNMRDIFNSLTTVIDGVHEAMGPFIEDINKVQKAVTGKVVDGLKDFGNQITAWTSDYSRFYSFSDSFKSIISVFQGLKSAAVMAGKGLQVLFAFFKPIGSALLEIAGNIGSYVSFLGYVASSKKIFEKATKTAGEWGNKIADLIRTIADGVGPTIKKLLGVLPSIGHVFSTALGKALDIGVSFGKFITGIFQGLAEGIPEVIKALGKAFESFSGSINRITDDGAKLTDLFTSAGIAIIVNNLTGIAKALKEPGKLLENFIYTMPNSAGKFKDAMVQIKNGFLALQGAIKADIIKKIAISIGIMAGALFVLSSIPADKLAIALGALAGVTFIFGAFMKSIATTELFSKGNIFQTAEITALAFSIENFAIAIMILVGSVKLLASMKPEELGQGLLAVGLLMAGIIGMVRALSAQKPDKMIKGLGQIYTIALAILTISKAVKELASLDANSLANGVFAVGVLMGAIAGLSHVMGSIKISTGVAMLGIAESINILAKSVGIFGRMKTDNLVKGITAVSAVMLAIAGMSRLMGSGAGILLASVGMLVIAEAMKELAVSVKEFGSMNADELAQGMEVLIGSLLGLTLVGRLAEGTIKGAVAIAILAASVKVFGSTLAVLAKLPFKALIGAVAALAIGFGAIGAVGALLGAFAAGPLLVFAGVMAVLGVSLLAAGIGVSAFAAGIATLVALGGAGLKMISGVLDEFIKKIPEFGNVLVMLILNLLQSMLSQASAFIDAGTQLLMAFMQGISNKIGDIIAIGAQIILKLLAGIRDHIYDIATVAIDIVVKLANAISNRADTIADAGITLVVSLINGMANALREHSDEVVDAFKNMWEAIWEFTITILQEIVELIPGLGPSLSDGLEKMKEYFRSTLSPEESKKVGKEHMKGYGEGASSEKKNVEKKVKSVAKGAKNSLGDNHDYTKKGKSQVAGYGSGWGSGRKDVAGSVKKVKSVATKELGQTKDFAKHGKDSGGAYSGGIGSKVKDAHTNSVKMKTQATSGISGASGAFSREGNNAGSGFVAGIKAWIGRAFSAGQSLTSSGAKGAASGHHSKSPAKDLIKQGKYAVLGYVVGVERNKSKAFDAMASMTKGAVNVAKTSMDQVYDLLDKNPDAAPSITPVIDTSDVDRGLAYIDSAFSSNKYTLQYAADIDEGVIRKVNAEIEYNKSFAKLANKLDRATETMNSRSMTNNITITGSEDPQAFADELISAFRLQARTGMV